MLRKAQITKWVPGLDRVAVVDFLSENGILDLQDDIDPQLIDFSSYPDVGQDDIFLVETGPDGHCLIVGVEQTVPLGWDEKGAQPIEAEVLLLPPYECQSWDD
jgi:hypothetical protein